MKTPLLIFISSLLLAIGAGAKENPLLSYRLLADRSIYTEVAVEISRAGETDVSLQRHGAPAYSYRTTLSPEEIGAFRAVIHSTGFFSLDEPPQGNVPMPTHTGRTTLTIDTRKQNKTLIYQYRPEMAPLEQMVWKLQAQASAARAIEFDDDIYTATGAVSPTMAGGKALQPHALKRPFMDYILTHQDRQKIGWTMSALAHLTTPEEYLGFVSGGLEIPSQRDVLLSVMGGNIPESHLQALYPLFFSLARDGVARNSELSEAEIDRVEGFISTLASGRYKPILPLLVARLEKHDLPYTPTPLYPIARMGELGLGAILPYLENSNANRRLSAIELIRVVSRNGPNGGFSNPLPKHEFDRMIPIFNNTVIPRLQKLTEEDPSKDVRKSAGEAVEEIRNQLKKEEIPQSR
jgi:hypothetical protein